MTRIQERESGVGRVNAEAEYRVSECTRSVEQVEAVTDCIQRMLDLVSIIYILDLNACYHAHYLLCS